MYTNNKITNEIVTLIRGINISMLKVIWNDDKLWLWCNVFHQSTEYFSIGIFINPIIHKNAKKKDVL